MLSRLAHSSPHRLASQAAPVARRQASTAAAHPHAHSPPHYSLQERLKKFVPTESYPLIAFVVVMSSFGIYSGVHAIKAVPGELRLTPKRLQAEEEHKPWEDPRALEGKW
ncbi:hypothetical protein JCM8097_003351 [Rhodosporidiobolus ruineniae]